jgi:hypothetical protein
LSGGFEPLIDNKTVKFGLSGWLGGWAEQNDNARVSVTFFNQTNQVVGLPTTIRPVYAAYRNLTTSLLFRQANGSVPVGTRSAKVFVLFTRDDQRSNDGAADNIALELYL